MDFKKNVILNDTCFNIHRKLNITCQKKSCKKWIKKKDSLNCLLLEVESGVKTLQEIGSIFNITRMRVCQIEKKIIIKLKNGN